MKVVGYVRVSTEKQADNGISLDVQRERIEGYARLYEYEIVEIMVDDGASAKTLDRPGLRRALDMLVAEKAQGLIVAKLDRLTRSVRDLGTLLTDYFSNGWALISVAEHVDTKSANGRMTLNLLMTIAEWERDVISERTKEALHLKRKRGERLGGNLPYGKRLAEDGVHLEDNPEEQKVITMIRRYRANGLTIQAIVDRLKKRGVKSRGERPLGVAQVHAIVKDAET